MQVWHLIVLLLASFGGGFAASIYVWPWIKEHALGAMTEARNLRARATALEEKLRSKI